MVSDGAVPRMQLGKQYELPISLGGPPSLRPEDAIIASRFGPLSEAAIKWQVRLVKVGRQGASHGLLGPSGVALAVPSAVLTIDRTELDLFTVYGLLTLDPFAWADLDASGASDAMPLKRWRVIRIQRCVAPLGRPDHDGAQTAQWSAASVESVDAALPDYADGVVEYLLRLERLEEQSSNSVG